MLSQRVLTAEYVDGCKINDVTAIQSMGLSLTDVSIVTYLSHFPVVCVKYEAKSSCLVLVFLNLADRLVLISVSKS